MDEMTTTQKKLRLGRAFSELFLTTADLYAVAMGVYLALRLVSGNRLWPVFLASTFLHWLLLPAFGLLPLAVWRRRWAIAAPLAACVVAFVWLFGALFLPQSTAQAGGATLTVMTANVGVAYDTSPEVLVDVIRESGADIVGLEELSEVQQAAIERELSDLYPYQALYGQPTLDVTGKGLLSRYPIDELDEPFRVTGGGNTHLRAVIDVDGRPLTVVLVHPPPPSISRYGVKPRPGVDEGVLVLAEMAAANGSGIMLGDFNTTDQSDLYKLVQDTGLTDAFRAVGWGFGLTWPVHFGHANTPPLVRIDYIWFTEHFGAVDAWVGPRTGADHLPVLAELVWRE